MPAWSSVLDVLLSWWTPLALVLLGGPFAMAYAFSEPVRQAPWAGVSWWQRSVLVALPLFWASDALDGEAGRSLQERWAKGLFVAEMVLVLVVMTVRWIAAGRPDEPVAVDDDEDDED